jgi:hypothetical protein
MLAAFFAELPGWPEQTGYTRARHESSRPLAEMGRPRATRKIINGEIITLLIMMLPRIAGSGFNSFLTFGVKVCGV